MRQVLLAHPQRVRPHVRVAVLLDGELRPLRPQQQPLELLEVAGLEGHLGLPDEDVGHAVLVVLLGHALRRVPVLVVHVHEDGLLRLPALDEVRLRLLELPLVLQRHRVLHVDVRSLVLRRQPRQLERELELVALAGVVDALARLIIQFALCCQSQMNQECQLLNNQALILCWT